MFFLLRDFIIMKIITVIGLSCFMVLYQFNNANGQWYNLLHSNCLDNIEYVRTDVVMISPSPRATVCRVGDHLEVTCSVDNSVLSWEFVLGGTNDRIERSVTSTQQIQEVVNMHSTVFLFSRMSELGALPLESTLEIKSVGQSLNGSTITCLESPSTMATTTVYINDGR